jgi:hypothetical protein
MKDTPVFAAGSPYTFANVAMVNNQVAEEFPSLFIPRHQGIYGRRWYFDSATGSMVCRLPHL